MHLKHSSPRLPFAGEITAARLQLDQLRESVARLKETRTAASGFRESMQEVTQGATTAGGVMRSAFGEVRNILAAVGVGLGLKELVGFFNESIEASVRLKGAQSGLQAVSKNLGVDFNHASKASKDLTKDGILNLTDSSKGLQNLLASGLNLKFATELMNKNKDAAVFNRQSHLGLSESIKVFTQGFKDELSTLTDATGVSINYGRALDETFKRAKAGQINYAQYREILSSTEIEHVKLAVAHTNSADKLDKQSKSILAGIGFLKELGIFAGNAASAAEQFQIQQAKLQNEMELTRAAIGERLQPAYLGLLTITRDVLKSTKDLFEFLASTGGANEYTGAIAAGAAAWALWRFVPWSAGVTLIANAVGFLALSLQGLAAGEGLTILGLIGAKLAQITAGSAAVSAAGLIGLGASFGALAGAGVSAYKSVKNEDLSKAQSVETLIGLVNTLQQRGVNAKPLLQQFNAGTISEDEARRQLGSLANEHFKANRNQYPVAPPARAGGGGMGDPDALKKIASARQIVDEAIASLNRKALTGIAAQFDEIDQRFRKIIEAEKKTGGAVRPGTIAEAEKAATAAKIAARDELFSKATRDAQKALPSNEDIQKDINATLEVANKAYITQIDNEFKLKQAMFATEMERLNRIGNMEAEIEVMDAAAMGRNKHESEQLELLMRQKQARGAVSDPAELEVLERFQGRKQMELLRNQYDETFAKIKGQAEGVFDAIFLRGKKGFAGLLDYIKGTFITGLKDMFGNLVATLFTGSRPGGGGAAQGGLFGGIAQMLGGGARAGGGGGIFGSLGGLFGGNRSSGGGLNVGNVFGSGSQGAGVFSFGGGGGTGGGGGFNPAQLFGFGGGGWASSVAGKAGGGAPFDLSQAIFASPTTAAPKLAMSGQTALGFGKHSITYGQIGKFLNGGLGSAIVGGAAGFGGGFGMGKLLGIGGKRSAIAGGVGGAAGGIGTALFGPAAGAAIGAAAGAITAGILRIFGGKAMEGILAKEIQRDFGINVVDNKLLKQIKNIGESAFGKDFKKKRFETLRLNDVQGLLLNYAVASGQDPSRLPIHQKFYGTASRSLSFDPSKGVPAFGNGGIVTRPTLALVGERGPEAIVPLTPHAQGIGGLGGANVTFSVAVDARGALDPDGTGRAVEAAVERGIMKALETGKIGAKRIDRMVTKHVNSAIQGDFQRRNILNGLIGT